MQGNWYTWLSLLLFLVFAGFWMSRYSKAMKLFPVLIIMPIIQASAGWVVDCDDWLGSGPAGWKGWQGAHGCAPAACYGNPNTAAL